MSRTLLNLTSGNQYILVTASWSAAEKVLAVLSTLFMNISALVLNLLLVATIVFSKSLRKQPDSILIGNLAMADFLVACCIMPFTSFSLINNEIDPRNGLWTFVGFANFLFCIASIINLAIMSLDQCLNINCPFWYQVHRTQSMALIMAVCVWVYSGLCGLPPFFGISSYTCFIPNTGPCSVDQWSGKNYSVIFVVVVTSASWGFGVLLLLVSNILIYMVAVKQKAAIKKNMVHKECCPKRKSNFLALHPSSSAQEGHNSFTPNGVSNNKINSPNSIAQRCDSRDEASSVTKVHLTSESAKMAIADTVHSGILSFPPIVNTEASNLSGSRSMLSHFAAIVPNVARTRRSKPRRTKNTPRCNCFPTKKHVKSLLIIVFAYFVSWTPFCSLLLIEIHQKAKRYSDLSLVFLWIGHLSSFTNPALYFYRYNRFRQEAKKLYMKICSKVRVNAS